MSSLKHSISIHKVIILGFIFISPWLCAEELSWKEIAFRVLKNSPDLRIQKFQPEIAKLNIDQAKSEFDPVLSTELQSSQTDGDGDLSVTSPIPGNSTFDHEDSDQSLQLSIQQKLKFGTQLELQGSIVRSKNEIEAPSVSFQGKDDSDNLALNLRQPILEGRGQDIQTTRIRQANLNLVISKHQLAAYAETLIYQTLLTSLDLYLRQQQLDMIEHALKVEKKEFEDVLLKIETGTFARTEKASAEAALATREQSKTLTLNAIEQARLDLVHALSPNPKDLWEYQIHFSEFKIPDWANVNQLDDHLRSAVQNRHDLQETIVQHKSRRLDVVYAKNGLLPRLDFFAQLGYSDFDRRDAYNAIDTEGYGVQYQLGLQLQLPLSKTKDQAMLQQTQYRVQQAETAIQNLKRILERDLRKVYSDFLTFDKQFKQVSLIKKLRKQSLDTEINRRQQGLSTSLLVERARNDYLDSLFQEIQTRVNEFKTRLAIFYRDGSLLSRLNLSL